MSAEFAEVRRLLIAIACSGVFSLSPTEADAQLAWGVNGVGGTGTWNGTNQNWWDGARNVAWPDRGTAIFAGDAGTVTISSTQYASALIFNTGGYMLQGGSLAVGTITTNAPATIDSSINGSPRDILVKNGVATLTLMESFRFLGQIVIEDGHLKTAALARLFDVTLADAPGAGLTLGSSAELRTLIGGGNNGGIVQPDAHASTVEITVRGGGSFAGVLQDNGNAKLALNVWIGSLTLCGANTYSGPTRVASGWLQFSGNGSALATSALSISSYGRLRLNNATHPVPNRIADELPINLEGGRIDLIGHLETSVEEQLGVLKHSGGAKLHVEQPAEALTHLSFASINRVARGTLEITGSGQASWPGLENKNGTLIAPFMTSGNDWATLAANNRIEPLEVYASDLDTSGPADDVKLSDSAVLQATGARHSLNLQNGTTSVHTIDLEGHQLTLTSGGLLTSGSAAHVITGGTLRPEEAELVVINRNPLTISAVLGETAAATGLTKSGAGTLTLSGTNTYTGNTAIVEGVLEVSSDENLGRGTTVEINGGELRALQSFTSGKGLHNVIQSSATIDTGSCEVVLTGSVSGSFVKLGTGLLHISGPSDAAWSLHAGTLRLDNAVDGRVTISGASTLDVSGNLATLYTLGNVRLELGGARATTLTTENFSSSAGRLTISFGLGSEVSDFWEITSAFSPSSGYTPALLFDFHDLGGVTIGRDYPILSAAGLSGTAPFGFASSAAAAGWRGTFSVQDETLNVRFTAVPEPSAAVLLFMGSLVPMTRRRPLA